MSKYSIYISNKGKHVCQLLLVDGTTNTEAIAFAKETAVRFPKTDGYQIDLVASFTESSAVYIGL